MDRQAYGRLSLGQWYKIRWQVLKRDSFQCQYCGQYAPNVPLEVDHVVAICEGGSNDFDNLKTSCWSCNRGKLGLWSSLRYPQKKTKPQPLGIFTKEKIGTFLVSAGASTAANIAERLGLPKATVVLNLYRYRGRLFERDQSHPCKWHTIQPTSKVIDR